MSMLNIGVRNCNNIVQADLCIDENKMNIFFGRNGSGKSTIAKAILLTSNGDDLNELIPYGLLDTNIKPTVEGVIGKKVVVFNEEYIRRYVYQKDSVLENSFNILVRTQDYDNAKERIDEELTELRKMVDNGSTIDSDSTIENFILQLRMFLSKISLGTSGQIIKRGGAKGILEGKGAFFNPPKELKCMKPFFDSEGVAEWAIWRRNGYEKFGKMKLCPYCTAKGNEETEDRDKIFSKCFDKSSTETADLIIKFLENVSQFTDATAVDGLKKSFGVNGDKVSLEAKLIDLYKEVKYLSDKFNAIKEFNGSTVRRDDLDKLEHIVDKLKIDSAILGTYFKTELLKKYIDVLNGKITDLLKNIGQLKGEIGQYNARLQRQIRARTEDINEFLRLAGFRYCFDVELNGEDSALAKLKYILPDESKREIDTPKDHLSWGEKNAFALIMFMFDAVSQNADIIVLDDPISSFDRNKKYAIINRLFKTGNRENSFYKRTVILLTHDFEPVIDYVKTSSGHQDAHSICAYHMKNVSGEVICKKIEDRSDILSTVVMLKEFAMDESMHISARIGCLRKYIEHNCVDVSKNSMYNILSSLIHGKEGASWDKTGDDLLSKDELQQGIDCIKKFIVDFDYKNLLNECKPEILLKNCENSSRSPYERLLILRAYVERVPEARERLKEYNDVLRKYVDETFHVENDYLYSLDVRKYDIVPEEYSNYAKEFIEKEIAQYYPSSEIVVD